MAQKYRSESGQIVLIVLLVLTIATTIALSLIGRSTTDVTISGQLEDSSRAFGAAEAGIEEALKSGTGTGGVKVLTPGVTYSATVSSIGGASGVYQFSKKSFRGTTETLWLVAHNGDVLDETPTYTDGSISLCWTSETTIPAIAVSILYKSAGTYYVAKDAFDPDATRRATNNFNVPTAASGGCNVSSMYRRLITFSDYGINPVTDTLLMIRIRPAYSDTQLAIDAPVALPLQGDKIESTGTTGSGVSRKILVYRQYHAPSGVFDASVYSQSSLSH
ncbi:pilus assembly PilX N-terminal domain-containing protein [Candidatus Gottesmanbacteria bacterium]|nr:pilus assembly PilX N-terminal domain-containing protein [Candidatus Gottesmanbacteria bacterium]